VECRIDRISPEYLHQVIRIGEKEHVEEKDLRANSNCVLLVLIQGKSSNDGAEEGRKHEYS
jgi:hypothetical protein